MTYIEKNNIKETFERVFTYKLIFCEDVEERKWVLNYLASGKGTIPYQTITDLDSLSTKPRTLGDLNRIYNIQDTLIFCTIFEQRSQLLQELFKFNPRKCNSASAFSGYVHRNKSKCNIVLPLDAKIVRIFEKTLI